MTQLAVGFKGADKALKLRRYREAGSWAGATVPTGAQTGLTGFAAFDGTNEWRVSNFVQQQAPNPVTGVLEAKPGDSALAGRIKNGVEGLLFGTAFESAAWAAKAEAARTGKEPFDLDKLAGFLTRPGLSHGVAEWRNEARGRPF